MGVDHQPHAQPATAWQGVIEGDLNCSDFSGATPFTKFVTRQRRFSTSQGRNLLNEKATLQRKTTEMFRRVIGGPSLALPDDHGDKSSRRYLCVSGLERLSDDDFVGRNICA